MITKETVQAKDRDNEKKKRRPTNPQQKEKFTKMTSFSNKHSISEPSPEYQGQDAKLNWDLKCTIN